MLLCLQVVQALERVDGILGTLMDGLIQRDLLHCVNMIIISDHGEIMAQLCCSLQYFNRKKVTKIINNTEVKKTNYLAVQLERNVHFKAIRVVISFSFFLFLSYVKTVHQSMHFCSSKTHHHFRACALPKGALEA